MSFYILIFESIHHVLKAEKLLIRENHLYDIIVTPKDISSDCGMAIKISEHSKIDIIKAIFESEDIHFQIYHRKTI